MTRPVRLTLSRARGFDLRAHSLAINGLDAVVVARPTKWGNPFDFRSSAFSWAALDFGCRADRAGRQEASVRAYREWLEMRSTVSEVNFALSIEVDGMREDLSPPAVVKIRRRARTTHEIIEALRGKNLACWCAPNSPCHADVLLEIANRPACEAVE